MRLRHRLDATDFDAGNVVAKARTCQSRHMTAFWVSKNAQPLELMYFFNG